jgi:hypothetical protein
MTATSNLDRRIAQAGTDAWYAARLGGVSATAVARASTPAGFIDEVNRAVYPEDNVVEDNDYMRFGRDWEQWIVENLPAEYGLEPNDWLIARDLLANRWQLATPDALNHDWSVIAEVKTTGKDWDGLEIPIQYRRQVQWQLYVTGAERCVFAWLLRVAHHATGFQPGWFEPKHRIIERDENMIAQLIATAEKLQQDIIFTLELKDEKEGSR